MKHTEWIRIVPGSRYTVLLIHGIVGTPEHFSFLLPHIPDNWNIYNLLLDGHGQGVEEFGRSSMAKWKAQVSTRLDEIAIHSDRVILVGHSMGTLFAIQEAIQRPDLISHLFLLAVPLYPFVRPSTALASAKLAVGAGSNDNIAMAMSSDSSVTLSNKPWEYLPWLPRFAELLAECRRTRNLLPHLITPCDAFQSRRDDLVTLASARLLETNPIITVTILEDSGHFTYGHEDLKALLHRFQQLFS